MKKSRKSQKKEQGVKKSRKSKKKKPSIKQLKKHDIKQPKKLQEQRQNIEQSKELQKQVVEKPKIPEKEQEAKQTHDKQRSERSLAPAFSVLFLFIVAIIGMCFVFRSSLFSLLEQYSRIFGTSIYAGFVLVSLIAAAVMLGIMQGTRMFKKSTKNRQYKFGGAIAGFLVTLMFLIGVYSFYTLQPTALQIVGSVHFVEEGKFGILITTFEEKTK